MSSCCGSVCLLVLLGVVLAFGSPVKSDMKQAHNYLKNKLNLAAPEIGSKPLFSSNITRINTSCRRKEDIQVINATLDVYMRIFSNILPDSEHHNTGTPSLWDDLSEAETFEMKTNLNVLKHNMETIKRRLNQLSQSREDVLSMLTKIKVDDVTAQKKALAEFQEIYHLAAAITSHRC